MPRFSRVATAVVMAAALALGLYLLLAALNGSSGFVRCIGTSPLGLRLTLLAGLVIGAVALVLLGEPKSDDGDYPDVRAAACPACGRLILGDWRLCPHCGYNLDSELGALEGAVPEDIGG